LLRGPPAPRHCARAVEWDRAREPLRNVAAHQPRGLTAAREWRHSNGPELSQHPLTGIVPLCPSKSRSLTLVRQPHHTNVRSALTGCRIVHADLSLRLLRCFAVLSLLVLPFLPGPT